MNVFKYKFSAILKNAKKPFNKWPQPDYDKTGDPHFLFIITQPYSGSTALAKVLNSCHGSILLQKKGEGQWLIPGLCQADRWNPDKFINWDSVRAVWLERIDFIKGHVQEVELVIEKSPPNLVRANQLIDTFPNHTLMAFNRNPFANCSSILYRNYHPESKSERERLKILRFLAERWLSRSLWLKKWIDEKDIIFFSYEDFCADPELCISKLTEKIPLLKTVDVTKSFQVKNYESQGIQNHNDRQIANLSASEKNAISTVLNKDQALVQFFGYDTTGEPC